MSNALVWSSFDDLAKVSRDIFDQESIPQPETIEGFDLEIFERVLNWDPCYQQSWLLRSGSKSPYLCLEYFEQLAQIDRNLASRISNRILLSRFPGIPHDFRAEIASAVIRMQLTVDTKAFRDALLSYRVPARRSPFSHMTSMTDGIDHLFDIPKSIEERLKMLSQAATQKAEESRYLILSRLLRRTGEINRETQNHTDSQGRLLAQHLHDQFQSSDAEEFIRKDLANELIEPNDYWLIWDQMSGTHTLAELLRIVLLSDDLQLPDKKIRPAVVNFYRSVLRISGRAIIGLRAGVFHVEHGKLNSPSVCYFGRDSALGKGCVIDGVGGVCIGSGAFLGGGFIPILIHTHKHQRSPGQSAIQERKTILPVVFCAEAGARLPMSATGLYESADYLSNPTPHPGLRTWRLSNYHAEVTHP